METLDPRSPTPDQEPFTLKAAAPQDGTRQRRLAASCGVDN